MSIANNEPLPLGLRWASPVFLVVGLLLVIWSIRLFVAAKCAEGGMLLVFGPNADYPFRGLGTGDMIDQLLGSISISHIAWAGIGCLITSAIAGISVWFKDMLGVLGSRELSLKKATFVYLLPTLALMAGGTYLLSSMLSCG